MAKYRVVIGMMSHETNTFSTVKTTLNDFKPMYGQEIIETLHGTRSGIGGYLDVLDRENIEYIPTIAATATPAGELRNPDYWTIVNYIKDGIKQAGKIDGVLLALHGAMVAEDVPEAEERFSERLRKLSARFQS